MLLSYTKEIEGVGHILFERSQKAKHLNIYIRPFKGVRVAVPYCMSFKKAEKIVKTRIEWIQKHLVKVKQAEYRYESMKRDSLPLSKAAAKRKLVERLNELAERHGFSFNRVFIRNQKTRWGSCSAQNNINLNIKLVQLPDVFLDYVILHELVHTRVKNHSNVFWTKLDKLVGDAKKMRSRLKDYGLRM